MNIKVLPAAHHLDCYTGSASMLVFTMSNDVSAHAEKIRHLELLRLKWLISHSHRNWSGCTFFCVLPGLKRSYTCEMCSMTLNSVAQYHAHLQGSKHQNKWVDHATVGSRSSAHLHLLRIDVDVPNAKCCFSFWHGKDSGYVHLCPWNPLLPKKVCAF